MAGETLRILLVSARPEAREELDEALKNKVIDFRQFWASQADSAVARAQDVLPHVILVDNTLDGASQTALIAQLVLRAPSAAVVALIDEGGLIQARQAVLAGARGFLIKPLQKDDLVSTLQQVIVPRQARPESVSRALNGRIVAFCAPKGGTGRTTLAVNTAVSLFQETNQPVVLVDADYSAPALDVALNLQGESNIADILPRISRLDEELVAGVLARHTSGLRVLLAPPPADLTTPISLPQVQQVLAWLRRMFQWVIVDLGLPLDETAFAFLDGADRIVMSVLPEMVGLRNTRLMLDQLQERGYPEERVWLVLNRATLTGGISTNDIEQRLHVRVHSRIPDDQPLATYSVNRGVPLVLSHRRSALARAFRGFAQNLVEENAPASSPAGYDESGYDGGFLGRLRGLLRSAGA